MIGHFLKRDFLDFRLLWIGLLIVTLLWAMGSKRIFGTTGLEYLFFGYIFFGMLPQNFILGSPWRTQHQISRHYLLSLPLAHKNLFLIQNIRMMIFGFPALALGSLLPFWGSSLFDHFTGLSWVLFYSGLVVSFGLLEQIGIWTTLEWERVTSYLQPSERFGAYMKIFVGSFGVMIILSWAWVDLLLPDYPFFLFTPHQLHQLFSTIPFSQIVFPAGLLLLGFWIPHNARRWCVTL